MLQEFETLDYYSKAAVIERWVEEMNSSGSYKSDHSISTDCSTGSSLSDTEYTLPNSYNPGNAGGNKAAKKVNPKWKKNMAKKCYERMDSTASCYDKDVAVGDKKMTLGDLIAEETSVRVCSVAHCLLTSLPVKEIITTNYDDLIERAWQYSGNFSVLPFRPVKGTNRWLLKMHGSSCRPSEIVLTKRDYIRYEDRFAALGGIVQSTLLTRHLLCVGFSLDDDNFQRIFDSVRKARSPSDTSARCEKKHNFKWRNFTSVKFAEDAMGGVFSHDTNPESDKSHEHGTTSSCATAIILKYSYLKKLQWKNEIDVLSIQEEGSQLCDFSKLARQQEIFLDLLSAECAQKKTMKFLMKDRYAAALSDGEIEVKNFAMNMALSLVELSAEAKECKAYGHIKKCLQELGC